MVTIILDCARLAERGAAHAYLAQMLALPDYYGANLDALYDCLTEKKALVLVLMDADVALRGGGYTARIVETILDAARDNPSLGVLYGYGFRPAHQALAGTAD